MKKLFMMIVPGCLLLSVMTGWRVEAYKKIKKQLAGDEEKIVQVYKYKQDITAMEKKALKWQGDEDMFDAKIPAKADKLELLREVTVLADNAGIADAQLQLGQDMIVEAPRQKGAAASEEDTTPKKGGKLGSRIKEIRVTIDINSSYSELLTFLDRIRQAKRLINIERLTLSREEKVLPNTSLHLDTLAYFIPPGSEKK